MDLVLSLLGLAVYAACVVVLAAAMTWLVVRLTPARGGSQQQS